MVEVVLAIYITNHKGHMTRKLQALQEDVKLGRKFYISEKGNMKLNRSIDKTLISLTNFDENSPNNLFKVYAWTSKDLKGIKINPKLDQGMSNYISGVKAENKFHELIEVQFIGSCDLGVSGNVKIVMLKYIEKKNRSLDEM